MMGPYTHQIDPILFDIAGVHLWWYGLGFALGFLHLHLTLRRSSRRLGLSDREVWSLSLFLVIICDYPTHRLPMGTGQTLNLLMVLLGAILLYRSRLRRQGRLGSDPGPALRAATSKRPLAAQRVVFACLLLFCLTIPSNWTQDVPSRYGKRHPGLTHSWLYPRIDTDPPPDTARPQ